MCILGSSGEHCTEVQLDCCRTHLCNFTRTGEYQNVRIFLCIFQDSLSFKWLDFRCSFWKYFLFLNDMITCEVTSTVPDWQLELEHWQYPWKLYNFWSDRQNLMIFTSKKLSEKFASFYLSPFDFTSTPNFLLLTDHGWSHGPCHLLATSSSGKVPDVQQYKVYSKAVVKQREDHQHHQIHKFFLFTFCRFFLQVFVGHKIM